MWGEEEGLRRRVRGRREGKRQTGRGEERGGSGVGGRGGGSSVSEVDTWGEGWRVQVEGLERSEARVGGWDLIASQPASN